MTNKQHSNTDIQEEITDTSIESPISSNKEKDTAHESIGEVLESSETIKNLDEKYEEAQAKIKELENTIKTLTSVAATSQSQYLSLK